MKHTLKKRNPSIRSPLSRAVSGALPCMLREEHTETLQLEEPGMLEKQQEDLAVGWGGTSRKSYNQAMRLMS